MLTLFQFKSTVADVSAVIPAASSQAAFLQFLWAILYLHKEFDQRVATLELFSTVPVELSEV